MCREGNQKGTGCKRVPEMQWTRQETVYKIKNEYEEMGTDLFNQIRYE